ncbi:MAG TPA: SGNH/GDSL hydrolase family protein [Acidobacteriaceae bacterium]
MIYCRLPRSRCPPSIRNPRVLKLLTLCGAAFFAAQISSAQTSQSSAAVSTPPSADYVALGSSIAAGPGVGTRVPGSPAVCMRSQENYPHLYAAKRNISLADVTCSGATTAGILTGQLSLPPQIAALGTETKLVTIAIGGNDVHYVGNLFAWSCQNAPDRIPDTWRPWVCNPTPEEKVDAAFGELEGRMRHIVAAVRQRSPHARILFIDYMQLLPPAGSCPDRLPLTDAELVQGRAVAARLAVVTAKVAEESGVDLLKASSLSAGHDVCAADSWVFPLQFPPHLLEFAPLAYHPNEQAMHAIADALEAMTAPR